MRRICRTCTPLALPLVVAFLSVMPSMLAASKKKSDPIVPPELVKTATGTAEVGILDNAPYRINMPANWNHSLVVYFHGYSETPYVFHAAAQLGPQGLPMYQRGYAVIESGYSATGWALDQALDETENLRKYFVRKYGQPKETIAVGGSMGGLLTSITIERNAKPYLAGLDLCGAVGPTYESFTRRFATRAAFDAYFPNLLPTLVPPATSDYPQPSPENDSGRRKIMQALRDHPASALAMRNLMALHTDEDVAHMISYISYVVADMQHKAHGNPFDNRNYLYTGAGATSTAEDNKLNDAVRRYPADPAARAYLIAHYTPTGKLTKPLLALHTTYDPLIPGTTLALYGHIVEQAGFGDHYIQQYVHHDGHCNILADEVGTAFDELLTWAHTGKAPTPGPLR